jgi:hypothetical protein
LTESIFSTKPETGSCRTVVFDHQPLPLSSLGGI